MTSTRTLRRWWAGSRRAWLQRELAIDIVVARSAWEVIVGELDRVAPREGVVLPLIALETRTENPCAQVGLSSIQTVVLAEARCLPAHLQSNSAVHVAALRTADDWADDVVRTLVRQSPRLRAAAYLHSHPFAFEHTEPSRGDIDGHMRPLLARNTNAGLAASFSFIACSTFRGGWRLPCFAMDADERIHDLGDAEVVDDTDPRIVRARCSRQSRPLLRHWKQQLRRRGFAVAIDDLFGGWTRARVQLDPRTVLVVLFPLDLPTSRPRYHVIDLAEQTAHPIALEFSVDGTEVLSLVHREAA